MRRSSTSATCMTHGRRPQPEPPAEASPIVVVPERMQSATPDTRPTGATGVRAWSDREQESRHMQDPDDGGKGGEEEGDQHPRWAQEPPLTCGNVGIQPTASALRGLGAWTT
jgi:hypothetical protein